MLRLFLLRNNENAVRDIDWFVGKLTIYDIRTLRGKMNNVFGKDAFTKGYIEVINYTDNFSVQLIDTKESLNDMEGN